MKRCFTIFTIIFFNTLIQAQVENESHTHENKIRVGGQFGLNMGSNSYFGFSASPFVGYAITPSLESGLTAGYRYGKSNFYKSNLFSVGPYMNYSVSKNIFGRLHFEYYTGNIRYNNISNHSQYTFDENALWIGGGYQSGKRVGVQVGLMYNVLFDKNNSIFSNAFRPFGGVVVSL